MKPGKPSATARLIARATVFVARDPKLGHLVPPRAATLSEQFLRATSSRPDRLLWLIEQKWFRAAVTLVQALTIPGIFTHYAVRKLFLEAVARQALEDGTEQVVVLGAGFDSLCQRLSPLFPSAIFIEVDHSATQKVKAEVLEKHAAPAPNLHLLTADLVFDRLQDVLATSTFYRSESRTLYIAEGLLMYLEPDKIDEICGFIGAQSAPDSLFAFTFLEPQANGSVNFQRGSRLIDLWLSRKSEGFRWGIKRRSLGNYLASKGFKLQSIAGASELRRRFLKGHARLARGEYIAVASVDSC